MVNTVCPNGVELSFLVEPKLILEVGPLRPSIYLWHTPPQPVPSATLLLATGTNTPIGLTGDARDTKRKHTPKDGERDDNDSETGLAAAIFHPQQYSVCGASAVVEAR